MWMLIQWWLYAVSILVAPVVPSQEFTVLPSSSLEIRGSSNVHNFTCVFQLEDMIAENIDYNKVTKTFETANLQFPVASFDCGGRGINKDFRNLLNEKDYAHLQIRLLHITPISNKRVEISMEIEIAGVANFYKTYVSYNQKEDYLHAEGRLSLHIEDFGLEQPKRMLGLVVVQKEIDIYFNIDFI